MPRHLIAAILLSAGLTAWPALAQTGGTRPQAAIGLDAAGTRELTARLARTEAQRDAYADQLGLSRRLLRAVALQLGLANPHFTDAEFMAAADRARALQADNLRLREEISRLSDPALRDPAIALLTEAEAALDEGRLADAEAVYGRISGLRWDSSAEALTAWDSAIRSQAATAELQGSEEAFDRSNALNRQAEELVVELADRQRFAAKIRRMESGLREGETFGRRRGLERAVSIFRDEISAAAEEDPLAERWLPAHAVYVRALSLLGERDGGEAGKALLDTGMLHLAHISRPEGQETSEFTRLPLEFRVAFLRLAFNRFELMEFAEIDQVIRSPFGSLLNHAVSSLSQSGFSNISNGIDERNSQVLILFLDEFAPFIRRDDILFQVEWQGGDLRSSWVRDFATPAAMAAAGMAVVLLSPPTEMTAFLDPERNPDRWMEVALLSASTLAFEADSGISMEFFRSQGVTEQSRLADLAAALAVRVRDMAGARGNDGVVAQSQQLLGEIYLIGARSAAAPQQYMAIDFARTSFEAARRLRPVEEQPLGWADATHGLARVAIYAAQVQPDQACIHLATAHQLLADELAVVTERRPRHSWIFHQMELSQIGQRLTDGCPVTVPEHGSAPSVQTQR